MLYLWEIEEKDKVSAIDYRINNILLKFLVIFLPMCILILLDSEEALWLG